MKSCNYCRVVNQTVSLPYCQCLAQLGLNFEL